MTTTRFRFFFSIKFFNIFFHFISTQIFAMFSVFVVVILLRALTPGTIHLWHAKKRLDVASIRDFLYRIQYLANAQDANHSLYSMWLSSAVILSLHPMVFALLCWFSSDRYSRFDRIDIKCSHAPDTSVQLAHHLWKISISLDKVFPIERPNFHV